jgi:hypothetical protein
LAEDEGEDEGEVEVMHDMLAHGTEL